MPHCFRNPQKPRYTTQANKLNQLKKTKKIERKKEKEYCLPPSMLKKQLQKSSACIICELFTDKKEG